MRDKLAAKLIAEMFGMKIDIGKNGKRNDESLIGNWRVGDE